MSTLDKKLKKLSREYAKFYGSLRSNENEYIDSLYEAFEAEGRIKLIEMLRKGYMTKEEWERQAIKDGWHKECPPRKLVS